MPLPPPRRYRDERDLAAMLALLEAGRAAQNGSYYVHTGDLKWWLFYPPLGAAYWDHIYLWDAPDPGRLPLGWALLDPGGETFDVYTHPALWGRPEASHMLAWAEAALIDLASAAGKDQVSMFWVTPEDAFRIGWLEGRGYRITAQSAALARLLTGPIPPPAPPEGFTIRPCRGLAEVEARARAQYAAFGSSAPFEQYVQRFAAFMQSPVYSPEADLVAAAPDGQIAAFCITWADETNQTGLFEPVGTHPDFHRRGLGKAVMLAGLERLRALGMRRAIVCTGSANAPALGLYASAGFQPCTEFRWYTKPIRAGQS